MCQLCASAQTSLYSTSLTLPTSGLFSINTGAPTALVATLVEPLANTLSGGTRWNVGTASFSFYDAGVSTYSPDHYSSASQQAYVSGAREFTETQKASARVALQSWFDLIPVSLVEVEDTSTSAGVIRLASTTGISSTSSGLSYLPSSYWATGGDVWLNANSTDSMGLTYKGKFSTSSFELGSFGRYVMVHELGHALGLKHPFEGTTANPSVIDPAFDSRVYTVMSYSILPGNTSAVTFSYHPTTPMVLDVLTIQSMYGANMDHASGNDIYAYPDGLASRAFETIWDGGGFDVLKASGAQDAVIDLREGQGSTIGEPIYALSSTGAKIQRISNIWIAYGAQIEGAAGGSGDDTIIGNDLDNTFYASAGNDSIDGGAGDDSLVIDAQYSAAFNLGFSTSAEGELVIAVDSTSGLTELTSVEEVVFNNVMFDITTSHMINIVGVA